MTKLHLVKQPKPDLTQIGIVKELLPLVRDAWLPEVMPDAELTAEQDEAFKKLEAGVILTVLQRALPILLRAQEPADLEKPINLEAWNDRAVSFGDGAFQDLVFTLMPDGGIRVTMSLAVLWPGAVSYQRITGWTTLDATRAGLLRKWIFRNAEVLEKQPP